MPVTLEQVEAILTQDEVKFSKQDDGSLTMSFTTDTYRNPAGIKRTRLVVQIDAGGCCLEVFAPNAFIAGDRYSDAIFRILCSAQWRTNWVRFQHDEEDGEIRAQIEIPMMTGPVEPKHMKDAIGCLIAALEHVYPVFKRCYETGVVDFETEAQTNDPVRVLQTLLEKSQNTAGSGAKAETAALESAIEVLAAMKAAH